MTAARGGILEKAKPFVCAACGAEFESKEKLEEHGRKEHQKTGARPGEAPAKGH